GEPEFVGIEPEEGSREDEVSRTRHRQELGDALNDAEERGLDGSRHNRYRVAAISWAAVGFSGQPSAACALKLAAYEARALRCGFDRRVGCCTGAAAGAGACAAARVGPVPRQKLTIAAAMNTL